MWIADVGCGLIIVLGFVYCVECLFVFCYSCLIVLCCFCFCLLLLFECVCYWLLLLYWLFINSVAYSFLLFCIHF